MDSIINRDYVDDIDINHRDETYYSVFQVVFSSYMKKLKTDKTFNLFTFLRIIVKKSSFFRRCTIKCILCLISITPSSYKTSLTYFEQFTRIYIYVRGRCRYITKNKRFRSFFSSKHIKSIFTPLFLRFFITGDFKSVRHDFEIDRTDRARQSRRVVI